MNFLCDVNIPEIYIDAYIMERIKIYAKNMDKRGVILCDVVVQADSSLYISDAFLPEQTVDYSKHSATYEEISKYIGTKKDKYYGEVICSTIISTELSQSCTEFSKDDYKYFESLTELTDWMICGEVTKNGTLVLYYLDLDKRVAFTYWQDGVAEPTNFKKIDAKYKIKLYGYTDELDIKKEIGEMCIEKKYTGYTNYSQTNTKTETKVIHPKSELNKKDPDIFTLV